MERGDRPWGYYLVLHEDAGYKVKQFVVRPGSRLSLQRHRHRAEHWQVVRGEATVTLGKEQVDARLRFRRRNEFQERAPLYREAGIQGCFEVKGGNPAEAHPVGFRWFMKAKVAGSVSFSGRLFQND